MKYYFLTVLSVAIMTACNNNVEKETAAETMEETAQATTLEYQSFGEQINDEAVMTKSEMYEQYKNLKPGDTVAVKFRSKVNSVCQNKGCWMRLDMGDEEAMIKFKDYGFFMPKDIAGDEVIVSGVAFVDEMSVQDQRHFAEDAGKSADEIAAITAPKRTLSFTANGVLLPEEQ